MSTKFVYEVSVLLTLSRAEIELLAACSNHHYDGRCRNANKPVGVAGVNGEIVIWRHSLEGDAAERVISGLELDLFLKILECFPRELVNEATILYQRLSGLIQDIRMEHQRISRSSMDKKTDGRNYQSLEGQIIEETYEQRVKAKNDEDWKQVREMLSGTEKR